MSAEAQRGSGRIDNEGFAKDQPVTFNDGLSQIAFQVENRSGSQHETTMHLQGLPAGTYRVSVDGKGLAPAQIRSGEATDVKVPMRAGAASHVTISRS